MGNHHVEKKIDHMDATVRRELSKIAPDQALIRAIENHGIAEIPLPYPGRELLLIEFPEFPSVLFVFQKLVAFQLIADIEGHFTGAEFFKQYDIHAISIDRERRWQELPAKVAP